MKFLCVPCDEPKKLMETRPPEDGSMALVYACESCGYEMAMLTNPFETQLVGSLGVKIGPDEQGKAAAGKASKCPFTGVVQEMTAAGASADEGFPWTADANKRLATIPDFVRPMAKTGIEKYARDKGYAEVNNAVLDEAKHFFGM